MCNLIRIHCHKHSIFAFSASMKSFKFSTDNVVVKTKSAFYLSHWCRICWQKWSLPFESLVWNIFREMKTVAGSFGRSFFHFCCQLFDVIFFENYTFSIFLLKVMFPSAYNSKNSWMIVLRALSTGNILHNLTGITIWFENIAIIIIPMVNNGLLDAWML